jgi:branched-chain amino acid transport system permease protein
MSQTPAPVTPDPSGAPLRYRVSQTTSATRVTAVLGVTVFVVLVSLPAWGDSGTLRLLAEVFTLLALAQMWNLLAGYAGLVSIGQQAYVGLGAYGLYTLADIVGVHPILAVILTAAIVAVIALITSFFAFRLDGGYFAIGTWVIAEVFRLLIVSQKQLGAGTGVSIQSLAQFGSARLAITYWLALAVGFGAVMLCALIMRSRLGLSLRSVRDSDTAARSLGINVFRAKVLVYIVAAAGCSLAGSVAYMNLLRIQPTAAFGIQWTAWMIFIVIIGGLGRIEGPIIGTIVFIALRQLLQDYGSAYLIALGVIAIAVTLLAPRGLWGIIEGRWALQLFGIHRRLVPHGAPAESGADGATPTGQGKP